MFLFRRYYCRCHPMITNSVTLFTTQSFLLLSQLRIPYFLPSPAPLPTQSSQSLHLTEDRCSPEQPSREMDAELNAELPLEADTQAGQMYLTTSARPTGTWVRKTMANSPAYCHSHVQLRGKVAGGREGRALQTSGARHSDRINMVLSSTCFRPLSHHLPALIESPSA